MDRRSFIQKASLGLLALTGDPTAPSTRAEIFQSDPARIDVHSPYRKKAWALGMPGLFPGRVVEVFNARSIAKYRVSPEIVAGMVERGMKELTGERSLMDAWKRFIDSSDVVGIKVNPSGAPSIMSSPELVREIVRNVMSVGVLARNIVIYDRFAVQIQMTGYHAFVPPGVRVVGLESGSLELSNYDPHVYAEAGFFGERETRSYLAKVISRDITKIINVPNLKEHNASGVTGCLKNLGYGSFSNMGRSHHAPVTFTDPFIGQLCNIEPLRSKTVLHIMDGLRAVWHAGPFVQAPRFLYEAKTMYFGTDPVAIDTIELEVIEQKRREEGANSLWDRNPANLTRDQAEFIRDPTKNVFYRQPGHIESAGKLGLGVWERNRIDHVKITTG